MATSELNATAPTLNLNETYYSKNKEQIRARIALYTADKKAEIKEKKAEWYAKNRENELKKSAEYAAANKEHIKEIKAEWYLEQKKNLSAEAKATQKEYQRVYRLKQKEARELIKRALLRPDIAIAIATSNSLIV